MASDFALRQASGAPTIRCARWARPISRKSWRLGALLSAVAVAPTSPRRDQSGHRQGEEQAEGACPAATVGATARMSHRLQRDAAISRSIRTALPGRHRAHHRWGRAAGLPACDLSGCIAAGPAAPAGAGGHSETHRARGSPARSRIRRELTAARSMPLRRQDNTVGQAGLAGRDGAPGRRDAAHVREIEAVPARGTSRAGSAGRARWTWTTCAVDELRQAVHDNCGSASWKWGRRAGSAHCANDARSGTPVGFADLHALVEGVRAIGVGRAGHRNKGAN